MKGSTKMTNLGRLETTLENIKFQKQIMWDDLEKLEHILQNLKDGQDVHATFNFNDKIN